jgi:hypothetical protein
MKVIAYSLFGINERYTINMILNAELAAKFYPDWQVWVYYDESVYAFITEKLKSYKNVRLKKQPVSRGDWSRLMWRFYAYDDPEVECAIFRDADSYLSQREKDAVDQWLSTGKSIHIMREVYPGHNSKIMAGMWGMRKNDKIKSLSQMCIEYSRSNENAYFMDQHFLNNKIYPLFTGDMVVHDGNSNLRFNDATHEWPSLTYNDQYIGRTQYPPDPESGQLERFNQIKNEKRI